MADSTDSKATIRVTVKGEPLGDIVLRFYHDVAPNHVKNFIKLTAAPSTASSLDS